MGPAGTDGFRSGATLAARPRPLTPAVSPCGFVSPSPVTWGMLIAVRHPGNRRLYSLWMPNGDVVTHYARFKEIRCVEPLADLEE